MSFGLWLKQKRKLASLSQAAVSETLGYSSAQFVSNWERDLSLPPKRTLEKLSTMLNITVEEIRQEIIKHKKKEIEAEWTI